MLMRIAKNALCLGAKGGVIVDTRSDWCEAFRTMLRGRGWRDEREERGCGELAGCSGDGDDDGKGGVGNQPFVYPCLHVRHWLFLPTTVSPHFGQA